MNVCAVVALRDHFCLPVGMSDRSPGRAVPLAPVALGPTIIEKHVTCERPRLRPDHAFAMEMSEFADMVRQVRILEAALGRGEKRPAPIELARQQRFRRGRYDPEKFERSESPDAVWLWPAY